MIGKIGKFKIQMLDSVVHAISQQFESKTRLGNSPYRMAGGRWDESISFSGKVILKPNNNLDDLKQLVKDAIPVTLVLANVVYALVLLEEISFTKSHFLPGGEHISEEFSVKMLRYFG